MSTTTNEVAGIDIIARLDAFRTEMAKVKDIGANEARAMASALEKEVRRATKASQESARAARDNRAANLSAADAAGRAGSSASKLAGALSLVSPEAAEAARTVADLADVGEVGAGAVQGLGLTLTATATALTVASAAAVIGYGVWNYYATSADLAEQAVSRLTRTLAAVAPASERAADAQLEADRATGRLTDAEYAYARATAQAADARDEDIRKAVESAGVTQEQVAAVQLLMQSTEDYSAALTTYDQDVVQAAVAVNAINEGYERQVGALAEVRDATDAARDAQDAKAAADRAAIATAQDLAAAFASLVEVEQAEAAQHQIVTDAVGDLLRAAEASSLARLHGEDRVQAELEATTAAYGRQAQAALLAADSEEERQAIVVALQRATVAAQERAADDIADVRARGAEQAQQLHEEELDRLSELEAAAQKHARAVGEMYVDTISGALSTVVYAADAASDRYADTAAALRERLEDEAETLTGREKAELEARARAQEQAAKTAYRLQQTASVGVALMEGAEAAVKAYSAAMELGPPGLVLGPIAAGAALAFAGVQAGAIASTAPPTFHSGMAPDEISATLTRKEGVLTEQGVTTAGGPEAIRALNRGAAPAPAQPAMVVLDHQIIGRAMVAQLKRGPTAAAVRAGDRVGHRSR